MRLCLYQPDIAPNFGAAIRLCACLGVGLDFIEPCGFPLSDKVLRRAALDYDSLVDPQRHLSFEHYQTAIKAAGKRIIAIETHQSVALPDFAFRESDVLMLGRETAGTPENVLAACDGRVSIPMQAGARSLNVINAGAIALAEALRQTRWRRGEQ